MVGVHHKKGLLEKSLARDTCPHVERFPADADICQEDCVKDFS